MDKNGYVPSILPTHERDCYLCHYGGDTVRHEVFFGTANRKVSKATGCWVNLCPACHERLHNDPSSGFDDYLKRNAQWWFEQEHSREEFMKLFGRSYL